MVWGGLRYFDGAIKASIGQCIVCPGVIHSRYKNMILKLTPLLMTLPIIKGLYFEVRVHQRLL